MILSPISNIHRRLGLLTSELFLHRHYHFGDGILGGHKPPRILCTLNSLFYCSRPQKPRIMCTVPFFVWLTRRVYTCIWTYTYTCIYAQTYACDFIYSPLSLIIYKWLWYECIRFLLTCNGCVLHLLISPIFHLPIRWFPIRYSNDVESSSWYHHLVKCSRGGLFTQWLCNMPACPVLL